MAVDKIPYENGQMQRWVQRSWGHHEGQEWHANEPFEAEMVFDNSARGYSAAFFQLHNAETGQKYFMFISDVANFLQNGSVSGGKTSKHAWIGVKKGQNYGIKLYQEVK